MAMRTLLVGFVLAVAGVLLLSACAGSVSTYPQAVPTVVSQPTAVPATAVPPLPPKPVPATAAPTAAIAMAAAANNNLVEYVAALDGGTEPFAQPLVLTIDSQGNLYVVEVGDSVKKYDKTGKFLTKWGSRGVGDGQFQFIKDKEGGLGIAIDSSGNVFVADGANNRIQKFDSNGKFITKWGTKGTGDGQMNVPTDVDVDSRGNVYVTDTYNDRVQVFDGNGKFLRKWGSHGDNEGQFNNPDDVEVDAAGNVYVANFINGWIEKFDSQGKFIDRFHDCGADSKGQMAPFGLESDREGNILVADNAYNRICEFSTDGKFLGTWEHDGMGAGELFKMGIPKVADDGTIYIPDYEKNQILIFKHKK